MLATIEAQSGLGQAETGVQARARMRRATAWQRHWRLNRAGRTLAVAVTAAAEAGTQGYGRSWERKRDMK